MMRKKLTELAWQVNEGTYRKYKALSYSLLAKYDREGYHKLDTLFDKVESPSLTFGSAVDCLLTGTKQEFEDTFIISDIPKVEEGVLKVLDVLYNTAVNKTKPLHKISDQEILEAANSVNYQARWGDDTKVNKIRRDGTDYYNLKVQLDNTKTLLTPEEYKNARRCADALKSSSQTEHYFNRDPFNDDIEIYYQLKFKITIDGIKYKCMVDVIKVDYKSKLITLSDIKTTSFYEDEFPGSFLKWGYYIQAQLYTFILDTICKKDEYFKDFTILPFEFIVVNKKNLTPIIWSFEYSNKMTNFEVLFPSGWKKVFKNPLDIGKELSYYLSLGKLPTVSKDIILTPYKSNGILQWLQAN